MNLLAIDLASQKVGWAVYLESRLAAAGTWDIAASIGPGEGGGARWAALLARLQHVAAEYQMDWSTWQVAYEEVTFASDGGYRAAQRWGAAEGVLELWLHHAGVRPERVLRVHVADVKAIATGKGNAPKDRILKAARCRPDWRHIEFRDDNAADAAYVGLAAVTGMPAARAVARKAKKDGRPVKPRTPSGGRPGRARRGQLNIAAD